MDFEKRLEALYNEHPMIKMSKSKTFNEVSYVLRMDPEFDYCVSGANEDKSWSCIPSIRECFIPVKTLAKKVKEIKFDEYMESEKMICLTIILEG